MLFNTKVYDVMFPDRGGAMICRKFIAENLYENADDDDRRYQYMHEIIGHKKLDLAVDKADRFIKSKNDLLKPRITTK